jgi:hypothetical protein
MFTVNAKREVIIDTDGSKILSVYKESTLIALWRDILRLLRLG